MKIKFTKQLTLVDEQGNYHEFKEGKTYKLNDYWAKQAIYSGQAIEVKQVGASNV